jgi:predicted Rossmann fold flavoprotein
MKKKVLIIGAGAAGLMAAIELGQKGFAVTIVDSNSQVGRKVLISGGGRANFTNLEVLPKHFVSKNPHFCKSALAGYSPWDFISLISEHNISYHERKHGQLFCDKSAKDIVEMFLAKCKEFDVEIKLNSTVKSVVRNDKFEISTQKEVIEGDILIIASGGLSIEQIGASPIGYKIAESFGHKIEKLTPGLVPFTLKGKFNKFSIALAGVSIESMVSCNGANFLENILFTHKGLSGPAILQISNYWNEGDVVSFNLLPNLDLSLEFLKRKTEKKKLKTILKEYLPAKFVDYRLNYLLTDPDKFICDYKNIELTDLASSINNWQITPSGTEGYRKAEVTRGGVSTDNLSGKTMESSLKPDLYFIGEVVDVTGHLGGFNFQWAWASAYAASNAIHQKVLKNGKL